MQRFAVIGHPIKHTMSPFIHSRLFALSGIEVEYLTLDIAPEKLEFEMTEGVLKNLDGFNVTIPHKESIIPFVDIIDPSAQKYNAVNCVLSENGKFHGFSTDAFGFLKALETEGVELKGRILVLGGGGAARTLAREACDKGCEVVLAVRNPSKAEALKNWLCENGGNATITSLDAVSGKFDLCVNATSVGMYPNPDGMPITKEQLSGCKALFDAVYNPEKTKLISTAEVLGIKTIGGMAMLVWQAVKAHEYWYGGKFSTDDITRLIEDANKEMTRIFYEK